MSNSLLHCKVFIPTSEIAKNTNEPVFFTVIEETDSSIKCSYFDYKHNSNGVAIYTKNNHTIHKII
jgi:hypothetical protein